jgi:hypothetical protein
MSLSLYKIDEQYKQAFQELEAIEDLDPQIIEDSLAEMKADLDSKCLAVAAFIKNMDAEAKAVKDAEDSLKARRTALGNKAKRMREYLAAHLPGKLSDAQSTITPLKGRESIKVLDESMLPDICFKIERKTVAAEVKKAFDELPEGAAEKITGNASVMIK